MSTQVISEAKPHTIKKFELVEAYVGGWAPKLLGFENCSGIVYIDCMSNSGEYRDSEGRQVFGTPVRVARLLGEYAKKYPGKSIDLYFNDLSEEKIKHLRLLVPANTANFRCHFSAIDGNELLRQLAKVPEANEHCLVFYDPYQAAIDWEALYPFINRWSEIIINHMISDSLRGAKMAKKEAARQKYEKTYQANIDDVVRNAKEKDALRKRIEEIVQGLRKKKGGDVHFAYFPFHNDKNAVVYYLTHYCQHIAGHRLFKNKAWKTFDGRSSMKKTYGAEMQLHLDFSEQGNCINDADDECYGIKDIADYLQKHFDGRADVSLDEIWSFLDPHPVFPSDCYRKEIKNELANMYGATLGRSSITFEGRKTHEKG